MVGGNRGNGFSCQGDPATTMTLPDMLESVARQMRRAFGAPKPKPRIERPAQPPAPQPQLWQWRW